VIVISHDRALLNSSVNCILHLHDKQLTLYQGNYDTFDNTRRARLAEQAAMAKKQDAQRAHMQSFVERFRAKASKAKQAQSRLKMLEKMEPIAAGMERGVAEFNFPDAEELSPPIIRMDDVSTGYGDKMILSKLNLRIDPDDRIALLGANGQGKSTFSKLLAGELVPSIGKMVKSSKLRIGYFAQHQVDALNLDETPLQHISSILPETPVSKRRARLAAGGVGVDQVDVKVEKLSGGQKARLAMLLTTIHNPHILLLDEPTNHLDIESRDALVRALAAYNGAVILVSHDPFLINAVADRLWLVKGGTVEPYTDDMDAYRKLLLSERGSGGVDAKAKADEKKSAKAAKKTPNLGMLQRDVEKAEERMHKLEEMLSKIDKRLADPELYKGESYKVDQLNKKRAEIVEGVERAETIWSSAIEKFETAKGA
jgi:ATP-binding cassette subfamily F protein 3